MDHEFKKRSLELKPKVSNKEPTKIVTHLFMHDRALKSIVSLFNIPNANLY